MAFLLPKQTPRLLSTRRRRVPVFRKVSTRIQTIASFIVTIAVVALFWFRSVAHEISEIERPLWEGPDSHGWIPAASHRSVVWHSPLRPSNGFLMVRCNGGLNQQRSAICNAVVVARLMNATLVLPKLDANFYWHDESGFEGIYDVDHFISTLQTDVDIVKELPPQFAHFKKFQMNPPREAPAEWYTTTGLHSMLTHKVLYLTPFAHRLSEHLSASPEGQELQRLRCRVNFEALKFLPEVERIADMATDRVRQNGPFVAVHLRFEMDMLAFAGCVDIFNPEEQAELIAYRKQNFAEKHLESSERRRKGKCPLTPLEVGLILAALGYPNSTRVYLAAGKIYGGDRFMAPLRDLFPHTVNRTSVVTAQELAPITGDGKGLLASAVDYLMCLKADVFMPTYDGPSNFANNVMGHRTFSGFKATIHPDRKHLAPLFELRQKGKLSTSQFNKEVRKVMYGTPIGGPTPRGSFESFYTNPWPECFCRVAGDYLQVSEGKDKCSVLDKLRYSSVKEKSEV